MGQQGGPLSPRVWAERRMEHAERLRVAVQAREEAPPRNIHIPQILHGLTTQLLRKDYFDNVAGVIMAVKRQQIFHARHSQIARNEETR